MRARSAAPAAIATFGPFRVYRVLQPREPGPADEFFYVLGPNEFGAAFHSAGPAASEHNPAAKQQFATLAEALGIADPAFRWACGDAHARSDSPAAIGPPVRWRAMPLSLSLPMAKPRGF